MNAADYFQSYKNYFWHWAENGAVLVVPGGSTIAFREQVALALEELAEQGLPPFGAFLLAMIATNQTMDDSVQSVKDALGFHFTMAQQVHKDMYAHAFAFLENLSKVPIAYKTGRRRELLLQTIFTDGHNRLNVPTSKGLVTALRSGKGLRKYQVQLEYNENVRLRDFSVMQVLHGRYPSTQAIIDAMSHLPEPDVAELPLLPDEKVSERAYKDFVEELTDRPGTFQVGTLIKPIWAGFKVPIFTALPSEQPLGGVSDLANKGSFDKLLISEFANDDLLFLSRLANNEALYLHREMPPVADDLQRVILVDISLRTWGTPKILSFAACIAVARHPKAMSESAGVAVGNKYIPFSFGTADQVIDALQLVDAGLNPATGLTSFLGNITGTVTWNCSISLPPNR